MNLRWLWFDRIPLHLQLSNQERTKVRRRANTLRKELKGHPANRSVRWLLVCLPNIALMIALATGGPSQKFSTPLSFTQVAVFVIIWNWIVTAFLRGRSHEPFVYLALREFGYEVCPSCGYDLRKLPASVAQCPECGATRQPMRKQKLESCDLANPAIVQAMQSLGYTICRECGLMILEPSGAIESNCPECGSPRDTMPGRSSTED